MRFYLIWALVVLGAIGAAGAAFAADPVAGFERALTEKETVLLKGVDAPGVDQFNKIKTAYGTLQAVRDVQESLERGVNQCAKVHKDQAFSFQNQFQTWKNSVLPVIRQGQNRLDKMVLTQNFAKPAVVRDYLTAYAALVAAQRAKVRDVPVSELSACQAMVAQMADTQKIMAGMIRETLGLE